MRKLVMLAVVVTALMAAVAPVGAKDPPSQAGGGLGRANAETTAHVPTEKMAPPATQKVREAASFSWGETQP
jgi:hypothetical protein